MAQMVLILGESGTGKTASIRNCSPDNTAIVNPVGKPLPFKGHFDTLNNKTDARSICNWMKEKAAEGKKLLVVDDFQYILSVPYMNRIKEPGWDKWNDFSYNYFEIIEVCKDLPSDVVVAYMSHVETLDSGITTVKTIGKQLREKITIEGLFSIVLMTGVNDGNYYFFTQNNGKDTVKSPLGMFPSYAIDNDLQYVYDKICNYYEIGSYKTDAEMDQADAAVAGDVEKPVKGRRSRKSKEEIDLDNKEKIADYMEATAEAVMDVADGEDGVDFDKAMEAIEEVPKPELEPEPKVERRGRRSQKEADEEAFKAWEERNDRNPFILEEDGYFHTLDDDNYIMVKAGNVMPEHSEAISKSLYDSKVIEMAKAMNPPESPASATTGRRTRRPRG